jgi:hypothetical protein
MLKLESVEAFASIAETGSITSAARRLGLSKSASQRAIDAPASVGRNRASDCWNTKARLHEFLPLSIGIWNVLN